MKFSFREGPTAFGLGQQRAMFAIVTGIMILGLVIPLWYVMEISFDAPHGGNLSYWISVLSKKRLLRVISHSFTLAILVSVISTALSFLAAWLLWACRFPKAVSQAFRLVILTAFFLPSITYGFAVIYSFGREGLITRLIGQLPFSIYGFNGLLIAGVVYCTPFAFILVQNSFLYVNRNCQTVCQMLGDGKLRTFYMSALRPVAGSLCSAFLLTFFRDFTDFGIAASVGGRYEVLPTVLYAYMMGSVPDFGRGAVIAVLMLLPSVAAVFLLRYASRLNFESSQASQLVENRAGIGLRLGGAAFLTLLSLFILSVLAVVFVVPFVENYPYKMNFSLATLRRLVSDQSIASSFYNSLYMSALTAIVGGAVCYVAALLSTRSSLPRPAGAALDFFTILTNSVPGMVLGVGYTFVFSGSFLMNSFALIVLCNIVHFFTTPYVMCTDALSRLNRGYEITSAIMGDSYLASLRRVILPNSFSTICAVWSYMFINAMVTISAVVFICGARTQVMTTRIREMQYYERFDAVFVLSFLIFATNVAVKLFFDVLPVWAPRISRAIKARRAAHAAAPALSN